MAEWVHEQAGTPVQHMGELQTEIYTAEKTHLCPWGVAKWDFC